jgi:hypothetical protein
MDPVRPFRWNGALKLGLLGGLLVLHFLTRVHSLRLFPVSAHHDYYVSYEYALSFAAGQGLTVLALDNLSAPGEAFADGLTLRSIPSDVPVREFLLGYRDRLSREELDTYLRDITPPGAPPRPGVANTFSTSRILELYLAGFLWKWFGIDWHHLFAAHCLFNTASCLCVFLIARRLAGSYWAGLAAAALYCASPLQTYLSTVSLRDASPLWFAAAGFCLLVCMVDRFRAPAANFASFAALGAVATLGLGWRWDASLLPPVLGAGLGLVLLHKGRRLRYVLLALSLFAGAAGLCLTGINALCGFQRMKSETAYHIAFYGESTRCNVLGLENSFQIDWCDLQTYLEVCRRAYVANGSGGPVPAPFGEDYFARCKAMYLDTLRYNAYAWVAQFPRFYWIMLGGLGTAGSPQGVAPEILQQMLPEWAAEAYRLTRSAWLGLPWLFLLGVVAALAVWAEPMGCLCLLGFSAYYAAILLLVLPMQKHLALVMLPLHVFAGVGAWALVRLCRPGAWREGLRPILRGRALRRTLAGAAVIGAVWGGACGVTYVVSRATRADHLAAVKALARQGVPAPETLKGTQLFSVRIQPSREAPQPGYLLTVHTGDHPGPLVCRHVHHFRQGIVWGKGYRTLHRLHPNQTQYFFVSCCQGGAYGDTRPYACGVWVEGDAELVASLRVDLSHWDRPALSTVFTDDDRRPGSPRVPRPSTESYGAPVPLYGPPAELVPTAGPQSTVLRPLPHLLARDLETGELRLAVNNCAHLNVMTVAALDKQYPWNGPLVGDFDGDGLLDAVGLEHQAGGLWVARCNGGELACEPWGALKPVQEWVDLAVGDFDGDGFDDVLARNRRTGELAVARSTGRRFETASWCRWPGLTPCEHLTVADFNGDGKSDAAGLDPQTGQWWVALSAGDHFELRGWGAWPAGVAWRHVCRGDFDGDGKPDLAGWDPHTGQWWLALSRGDHFECRPCGATDPHDPWEDVAVGDIDADGKDDLVGWSPRTRECWVARSLDGVFQTASWGVLPAEAEGLCVADFNADGRADVAWRDPDSGDLWVGLSGAGSFRFERWGHWPADGQLTPLVPYRLWR